MRGGWGHIEPLLLADIGFTHMVQFTSIVFTSFNFGFVSKEKTTKKVEKFGESKRCP